MRRLQVALAILFLASPSTTADQVPFIINGTDSTPGQWPFMAALYTVTNGSFFESYKFTCGAVVWDNQTILTAAHCLTLKNPQQTAVYLGHVDRTVIDYDYLYKGKQIIIHEDYLEDYSQYEIVKNDIALLRLAKPINFTANPQIAPVPRPQFPQLVDPKRCVILGWGNTGLAYQSMHLHKATVSVSLDSCYPQCSSEMTTIRAGDTEANKGTCFGDSGGPLLCAPFNDTTASYRIIGITSIGDGNCQHGIAQTLAFFTFVPHYLEWIERNVPEPSSLQSFPVFSIRDVATSTANWCTAPLYLLNIVVSVLHCFRYLIVLP